MSDSDISNKVIGLINQGKSRPENLLQILIELQHCYHHIPSSAVQQISEAYQMSRTEVEAVIGFYGFLHRQTQGAYEILFSDNIVDRMLGGRDMAARLADKLNVAIGQTRSDGRVTIGFTSCTGMGDQGPAALINGFAAPALTEGGVDEIASLIDAAVPLAEWRPELFAVKANIRRKDILLNGAMEPGSAIRHAVASGDEAVLLKLEAAGLRGRGGAGFATTLKWRMCRDAPGPDRVVVCNADEGEPGTFKDRALLQDYADRVIEGMTLCASVIGANKGFLYLRGEYRYLLNDLEDVLQRRRAEGLLGRGILGQADFDFDIEIHLGAGAYICGEESALLESLEGRRGIPRIRPPFPVTYGYLGRPTVVNNVETFIAAAMIAVHGAEWFRSRGSEASTGTKLLSISGDCAYPGVYEFPYGISIAKVLQACGAEDVQAVQIAGPAGQSVPPAEFQRRIAFEDLATGGSFMIFGRERDLLEAVGNFSVFFVHESCGFCTPCRVGTTLIEKRLQKVRDGHATALDLEAMKSFGALMRASSHCGLGATAANPVLSTMEKFPHLYQTRLRNTSFEPAFDLNAALEEAREATGRDDPGAFLTGGGV